MSEYIITDEQIAENRRLHGKKLLVMPVIIRCRDCESYQPGMYEHFTCEYLHQWTMPDDFCAWAERKERIES